MKYAKHSAPSLCAQTLGYGGLIPFVGLALVVGLWPTNQAMAASALLGYSATIVSFLGAIHWGLAMRDANGQSASVLLWGVVPSLLAWLGLQLSVGHGLMLMAVVLWICFAVDRVVYTRFGLRGWLPMRLLLTVVASLSSMGSALRVMGFV